MIFVVLIAFAPFLTFILIFHVLSSTFRTVLFPKCPSGTMQWRRRPNTAAASGIGLIVLLAAGSECCWPCTLSRLGLKPVAAPHSAFVHNAACLGQLLLWVYCICQRENNRWKSLEMRLLKCIDFSGLCILKVEWFLDWNKPYKCWVKI